MRYLRPSMRVTFPFAALVDQQAMKTALLLNAVDPGVGGVLLSGHKGTGKSTAVRALASILPDIRVVDGCPLHCDPASSDGLCDACSRRASNGAALPVATRPMPYVELPLSATEDRLVGTLHVERALQTGERSFDPGLLAAAHRGILYVDEVNLLDDHLVDMLLDAAASGVNVIEREGMSLSHASRFLLVGTMNPEEGDLRPQFLDRFGLYVSVEGIEGTADRMELVRRRSAFEQEPAAFAERWREEQDALKERLRAARVAVGGVATDDDALELAVELAVRSGARGHRAELAIVRAARALAALQSERSVHAAHIAAVARFVLPHRIPDARLLGPETLEERVAALLERVGLGPAGAVRDADDDDELESMLVPGSMAAGSIPYTTEKKARPS